MTRFVVQVRQLGIQGESMGEWSTIGSLPDRASAVACAEDVEDWGAYGGGPFKARIREEDVTRAD